MERKITKHDTFTPFPVEDGDELYQNGIFQFNITRLIEYIQHNSNNIPSEEVVVDDFYSGFSRINESHVESVNIDIPVILAEIAPGRYNLIDGNHRMEKARRLGIKRLQAFKLSAAEHMNFLTSKKTYEAYVEYWNSKLEELK